MTFESIDEAASRSGQDGAGSDLGQLSFRGRWRAYQRRVLDELADHLDNESLHVVAAPGSGKTLLGLEVMRRLGKPTLILAPTITIRNQWEQRLISAFLPPGSPRPNWVSLDIKSPKTLTVATYQALHAAFSGGNEEVLDEKANEKNGEDGEADGSEGNPAHSASAVDETIARLKRQNVQTLVLDEAHHLRHEWWKALIKLKAELGKPTIVALTATPPYDVDHAEWLRYQDLCGPIDAEISVPELVLAGDLCAHQDYVYFTLPRAIEAEKLGQFHDDVLDFVQTLLGSEELKAALLQHTWIARADEHVNLILDDPPFFSSMLILLREFGVKPPAKTLRILGVRYDEIPELTLQWLETLLNGMLYAYRESFSALGESLDGIEKRLRRIGALERRRVCLTNPKAVQKLLASSTSKLDAIVDITRMESERLRSDLRLVILSDYIRRSDLPDDPTDLRPISRMGVVPIFESLRRTGLPHIKLGVLTASFILIPTESKQLLDEVARELEVDPVHIECCGVAFDERFLRVEVTGELQGKMVGLITELFGRGGITALIGTQALLGEGWDAPSVNTLILASTVGSYMMSNQMRGRAIRFDPGRPHKTANIWHLAAVDPESLTEKLQHALTGKSDRRRVFDQFDDLKKDLGSDVDTLKRRFRAFEGLSFHKPVTIENGFRRLALSDVDWNAHSVGHIDEIMKGKAADRDSLRAAWRVALQGDNTKPEMRETLESNYTPKTLAYRDTIMYLLIQAVTWAGTIVTQTFRVAQNNRADVYAVLFFGFIAAAVCTLPLTVKALWLWFRNGSLEGNMRQVGKAVLETLHEMNVIKTGLANMRVASRQDDESGIVYCRIEGATTIERSYFLEAMEELLSPVQNPRYVLIRRSLLWRFGRTDYHAVPTMIGQKKECAEYFAKAWNAYVGSSELVYTRTVEGRLTLLQARTKALSSAFRKRTDRISRWQ